MKIVRYKLNLYIKSKNIVDAFIIPVIHDIHTEEQYCLVKIDLKDPKNTLLIDSYPVSKNTLCEKELSTYLETAS